jgi:hypothetical protein
MSKQNILQMNRRTFVKQAVVAMLATGVDAKSYARILGANDRARLGIVGCGSRSEDYVDMARMANKQFPVEIAAVCDL